MQDGYTVYTLYCDDWAETLRYLMLYARGYDHCVIRARQKTTRIFLY